MREYSTARSVLGFAEFIAWAIFAIGVIALIAAVAVGTRGGFVGGLAASLPGMGIILVALLIIVFIQVGRAGVDTSERVGRLIQINRDGFQYLKSQSSDLPASFDLQSKPMSAGSSPASVALSPQSIPYKRYEISVGENGTIRVGKQEFMSIDFAKRYIDDGKPLSQQGLEPLEPDRASAPAEAPNLAAAAASPAQSDRPAPTLPRPPS